MKVDVLKSLDNKPISKSLQESSFTTYSLVPYRYYMYLKITTDTVYHSFYPLFLREFPSIQPGSSHQQGQSQTSTKKIIEKKMNNNLVLTLSFVCSLTIEQDFLHGIISIRAMLY